MSIRLFELRRFATGLTSWASLCELHAERRRTIGYRFLNDKPTSMPTTICDDCEAARQPSVLDVAIANDPDLRKLDKAREDPTPIPVLKGQRSLW